jgi:hypothetical protein
MLSWHTYKGDSMADGSNLILGTDNTANSQTSLNRTGFGDDTPGLYGLQVQALDGIAVGGVSGVGSGVEGISTSGPGIQGTSTSEDGVAGQSQTGNGVGGGSNSGTGVIGTSFQGTGVEGFSYGSGPGVTGASTAGLSSGPGVIGLSNTSFGVRGQSGAAVLLPPVGGGPEFQKCGVQGSSDDGTGVRGDSANRVGVRGRSFAGDGVFGSCLDQPKGAKTTGNGIHGSAPGRSNNGSTGPFAGFFEGDVKIIGRLYVGNTLVAHPLAMQTSQIVAAGVVDLDGNGEAVVELPGGLADLHTNFTYQLTAIGGPAPSLHVAQEIRGDSFKVGGGIGNLKVSWQVGGEAKDAPALGESASEAPYDEELAQEHERWTEQFARRLEELKDRMQHLLES